jgi:hypothetical protein
VVELGSIAGVGGIVGHQAGGRQAPASEMPCKGHKLQEPSTNMMCMQKRQVHKPGTLNFRNLHSHLI